jgi:isopentenyldiphosphate isomerase
MALLSLDDLKIGQTISFRTQNVSDLHEWIGTITGIIDFSLTTQWIQDLLPYDREVRKANNTIPVVEELNYIVLKTRTDTTLQPNPIGVCAFEWMDLSTLHIIEDQHNVDIRIYDIGNREPELINLLKANGFLIKKLF